LGFALTPRDEVTLYLHGYVKCYSVVLYFTWSREEGFY